MHIAKGVEFNTPFEDGCVALDSPDQYGNFPARDSDGVTCTFNTQMVSEPEDAMAGARYETAGVIQGGRVLWHLSLPVAA